jgi:hypothetical protein
MIATLLLLAQIVPVPAEPKPLTTTIAAIRSNPKKFDGQVVRLRGWVNQCQPQSCGIDERPATGPGGSGEHLSIAPDPKFDTIIEPLLPTYVEFDARLTAQCLIAACSGRAPVLSVISLRSVVSPEPPAIEN